MVTSKIQVSRRRKNACDLLVYPIILQSVDHVCIYRKAMRHVVVGNMAISNVWRKDEFAVVHSPFMVH